MHAKCFERLEPGKYKDAITGVMLVRECDDGWVICIDDYLRCAFVTSQWGEALATYRISGFSTMKDAKQFDFFSLFCRTGKPYKNKKGVTVSVPVTGLCSISVIPEFTVDGLALRQGYLF